MTKAFGAECRQHYPEAATCICNADGCAVSARSLSLRSMNFGQRWRTEGIQNVPYSVELPLRFWLDFVARELPEIIEDARKFPDDDDALAAALRLRGLPATIDQETALDLAPLLVHHFAHDLLLEWLGDGPPDEKPGWVINTIDTMEIDSDRIRLSGFARPGDVAVRYQDV